MSARLKSAISVVLRPLQFLLYFFVGFFPRRSRQFAFGCWSGHRFGDNSGAVFLHLSGTPQHKIDVAWITNEADIRDRLRADGHRAFLAWSPRGIWWTLRSGVFVYDSLPKDINFWMSRGAKLVLLRHGIGIKKIERAIDATDHRLYQLFHGSVLERLFWGAVLPWHLPVPDLLMACSPAHASQGKWFYGIDPDNVRITGFARHDRLVNAPAQDRGVIPTVGAAVPTDRPVFVYLPTFREGVSRQSFDWDILAAAAEAADVTIAVKLHYVDADRGVLGTDRLEASDHLRMIDPYTDPSDVYPHADGMISDFSSAPFDFMLLERPVVYYIPDLESFTDQRPLMFDIEDVAVGALCRDEAELSAALREARVDGIGDYRERYDNLRARFHTHAPGGASQRVVDAIAEEFFGVIPVGERSRRYHYEA
ncbi:MAG: CDP-glycerol glycerophosphotransferase (TagB/SpsB family) [Candidatus Aldehydirespiratoraceae bacterium]|jgi:CDP-glycerol glycerophosphotransferase (TagB/SpsB family)